MSKLSVIGKAATMSSLEIAELTGKDHKNVLRDIRETLQAANIDVLKFERCYSDGVNKGKVRQYDLPRRECDLVVSGYSVKYRLAIIDRWHELEAKQSPFQLPQTLSEALLLAGQLAAEKEAAIAKIEADKPKVQFAERVRNMQGACSVGAFAKSIGIGRNTLFRKMREDGILMAGNMPYQRYIDDGRFVVIEQTPFTDSNGKDHPSFTTYITGKGQVWLEKRYREQKESA